MPYAEHFLKMTYDQKIRNQIKNLLEKKKHKTAIKTIEKEMQRVQSLEGIENDHQLLNLINFRDTIKGEGKREDELRSRVKQLKAQFNAEKDDRKQVMERHKNLKENIIPELENIEPRRQRKRMRSEAVRIGDVV